MVRVGEFAKIWYTPSTLARVALMYSDLFLVGGVILIALALMVLPRRVRNGRPTATGVFVLVLGGAMVLYAHSVHPNGYRLADVPATFERVMIRMIN